MPEIIDLSQPHIQKALDIAIELVNHCREHNLNETLEMNGVAWCAQKVKEYAYIKGKNYEKKRISGLLGLNIPKLHW